MSRKPLNEDQAIELEAETLAKQQMQLMQKRRLKCEQEINAVLNKYGMMLVASVTFTSGNPPQWSIVIVPKPPGGGGALKDEEVS